MPSFDDRLAALEEHVVAPELPSAEDFLARAEEAVLKGDRREVQHCLSMARISRNLGRIASADESEDDDDA